jgi:NMD protein affecting ribosome stability and mRNA decay
LWKKGTCDECGTETQVKRSRGRNLCRDCYRSAKKKRKMEELRRGEA